MNKLQLRTEVPFDQYSRQFQVMTIVNELRRQSNDVFTVVDVGGYKGRTADFLPNDKVTVMDLFDVKEAGYVQGSALEMPFKDDSFDFVVSFDVLEHIPSAKRNAFVKECARVAKRGVIICAPHKTPANERAEQDLNELYRRLHNEQHPWLKEHIEYGIPDFARIESFVKRENLHTALFPSNKTRLWVGMQQAIFTNSNHPLASESLTKLNSYYNRHFEYDGGESADGSYRLILCGFVDAQDAERVGAKFGAMNKEISADDEVALVNRIHGYYEVLLDKMSHLQSDYKGMHEHERSRAAQLELNGQKLWERINEQEKEIEKQTIRLQRPLHVQLKEKVHRRLRGN